MQPGDGVLRIDCDECVMDGTTICTDCVVTFLCGGPDGGLGHRSRRAVVLDGTEVRALRALHRGGLVPALRHRRRVP